LLIAYKEGHHLYLVFQDFVYKEDEVYKKINIFPKNAVKSIITILKENFFSNPLSRQKNYINSISTYIDNITDDNKQYFFHLYILPKDLDIEFDSSKNPRELIDQAEKLSIKLFKLYHSLDIFTNKKLELLKHFKGTSFLQLEVSYYIEQLEKLYNNLLNYTSHHKNTIICSDKRIGLEIDSLNLLENNPLKNYQFIRTPYQKDLLVFIYSTLEFLIKNKFEIFKYNQSDDYNRLIKLTNKIKNHLLKIGDKKNILLENISKDSILEYISKYKNKKEIKDNIKIFNIIQSIFYTQLDKDIQFFLSIDLTKVFEKIVEKRLNSHMENLYIGNESASSIIYAKDNSKAEKLNSVNNLISSSKRNLKQYPDFLIESKYNEEEIFHIIDAKYKLEENIPNENDTRQILIYSLLFNKEFSVNLNNQKHIKKIIVYANKSTLNLNEINEINFDLESIDLKHSDFEAIDNIFASNINFIGINVLSIKTNDLTHQ
jgi:hypothetical protein